MSEISQRLATAIRYLKDSGLAKNDAEIARRLGVTTSTITMTKRGRREPTWEMLLKLCDIYPINFWWLRSGEGDMIGNGDRLIAQLKKIEVLEKKIRELEQ